jgi:hypothetical protein
MNKLLQVLVRKKGQHDGHTALGAVREPEEQPIQVGAPAYMVVDSFYTVHYHAV